MTQTLEQRFEEFATATGADMGAAQSAITALLASDGNLANLSTAAKGNLVAAINELVTSLQGEASARGTAITATQAAIATEAQSRADALIALKTELLGGSVSAAMDTFQELGALIESLNANGGNAASAITALANTRVSAEVAQTFTGEQKATARGNIGAADAATVTALAASVGNTDRDFVAVYNAAKAAAA